ncbi:MAG: molybdopterin converting factor subunit 1 [Planctomycetes bacterium]|nr:molybdopterin converting factor subunit 1 [Planctomycetota bacterium]
MTVRVKLFAVAKERAACDELTVELPTHATIADLRRSVTIAYPALAPILSHAMWAVDTAYANDNTKLTEQSEVALIPPVSGG